MDGHNLITGLFIMLEKYNVSDDVYNRLNEIDASICAREDTCRLADSLFQKKCEENEKLRCEIRNLKLEISDLEHDKSKAIDNCEAAKYDRQQISSKYWRCKRQIDYWHDQFNEISSMVEAIKDRCVKYVNDELSTSKKDVEWWSGVCDEAVGENFLLKEKLAVKERENEHMRIKLGQMLGRLDPDNAEEEND